MNWNDIAVHISHATQTRFEFVDAMPLAGGCINQTWCMQGRDNTRYFIKLNDAAKLPMFAAESAGLTAIAASNTIRVPQPVVHATAGAHAFLVLEYLDLSGSGNAHMLGQQLAALHRNAAPQFGWQQDNTLGETLQRNDWTADWITFWREQRLGFQLALAKQKGYDGELQTLGQRLLDRVPDFFSNYQPAPSLLHGDLWGGNHAYTEEGTPVLFDPAPYYGDREADLAMTELFGGFDLAFYTAYRAAWPLHADYGRRKILYNLYHVLNHANLFGGGYARQAEGMMRQLLSQ
ncbi:MAG: fructosamine kinase family protein [Gallionellaceae bacterium]|nr:fructosamine kinase family protein [Gallionellaceae bacterium]